MRLILKADRRSPSDLLRKRLTWTNLAIRRKIMRLKVVRRCTSGKVPVYLSQMFKTNNSLIIGVHGGHMIFIYLLLRQIRVLNHLLVWEAKIGIRWYNLLVCYVDVFFLIICIGCTRR